MPFGLAAAVLRTTMRVATRPSVRAVVMMRMMVMWMLVMVMLGAFSLAFVSRKRLTIRGL